MKSKRGFTLIESILLIVLLAILSAVFMQMFSRIGSGVAETHDMQVAQSMIQECHAYLVQQRRKYGYTMNGINDCSALPGFQSYGVASVTVQSPYTGSACPSGATCKLFHISVPSIAANYEHALMFADF